MSQNLCLISDKIRTLYKYVRILVADTIEYAKMKEKIEKEYRRRTRKLLKTKQQSRKMGRKTTTFQAKNEQNLTRENLDTAKKGKILEK